MAVKIKLEENPDGGVAIVLEEDGSGDFNRIMDDLCKKHKSAGPVDQSPEEIFTEILQAVSDDQKANLDIEMNKESIE